MSEHARHVRRGSPPPRAVPRAVSALILIALAVTASAGLLAVGPAEASSFTITRATWRENDFRVEGRGTPYAMVEIADATNGAPIASVGVNREGRWSYRQRYGPPPCVVRATSEGVSLERVVDRAEKACGGGTPVTLSSLQIAGPSSVNENSTASYVAMATFSDGSTATVTASATWNEDSPNATIDAGTLTAGEVGGDESITVGASYASGGVTRTASLAVTIQDLTVTGSHAGRFMTYEGTRTCLTCHLTEAEQMHQSAHYQWQGDASETVGLNSPIAGKLGGINDFCIYPDINWLGKLTNVEGQVVDGGCARCHTGLGLKPTPFATTEQLENIDCLVCHSPSYKRTLALVDGQYRFVADVANMSVSLLQAASDIRPPDSATCLTCHAKAGGGDNFKRGDLEMAQAHPSRDLDVHLASTADGGAGLTCTSCHETAGHRVAGRGIDLRERDSATVMACANCHGPAPHGSADINKHTARVNCTVCHIPSFARQTPTDMLRDWSQPGVLHPETGLYEPWMRQEWQVIPTYAFFNGTSQFYQFGDPAVAGPNGRVLMAGPLGSINDPGAKIQAMKSHEGVQPIDPATRRLLPLKIGIFFQTGDLATAVEVGANAVGWPYTGYEFAATERKMGLYHQVAPKEAALTCATCHDGTRMDFASLGYTPVTTYNGKPLCASCHGLKTGTFTRIHEKHVTDRKYDCSTCHTFSKAQ